MRCRKSDSKRQQMNRLLPFTDAPLFHALQLLATADTARFHMPGHKGQPVFSTFREIFAIDFTETYQTGNLYLGDGPIHDAEAAAARYYGAEDCFFLTGGSSQGILSMLAAVVGKGGSVLLDRSCHQSVCHACALLDITPYFFSAPLLEPFGIAGAVPLRPIEQTLLRYPAIKAVLVTSPTYYGVCRDLSALASLCHAHQRKLLVDSAHGAHFPAVGLPSPLVEGADAAVLSMHKTLPCLGQGAVLLSNGSINRQSLRENTALFGTSSPSYPIMASIDVARAYLEGPGRAAYRRSAACCLKLRRWIQQHTCFTALSPTLFAALDPCRLTVCTAGTDITGRQLADTLWAEYGIACEMADERNVVFILTCSDTGSALRRLRHALAVCSRRREILPVPAPVDVMLPVKRMMSVRKAWFSTIKWVSVQEAEGKICARPVTPYPPGIPLLWPGEKITALHVAFLREKWYTIINEIAVVVS